MSRRVAVFDTKEQAADHAAQFVLRWCDERPGEALGGATGRTPVAVWNNIWDRLDDAAEECQQAFARRPVLFLDEYFGAFPAYHHWAWRHLRVGRGGFCEERVFLPRGAFFDERNQLISSDGLSVLLSENPEDWHRLVEAGEDGEPPEINIAPNPENDTLYAICRALDEYDAFVRSHPERLQMLGIGAGGMIGRDPDAGGHIGFVEAGAARRESSTMLVQLASSTVKANADDFRLADGSRLEPAEYAVTQGIDTILSAESIVLMAWGEKKRSAVERMLLGTPNPKNPAAWLQEHNDVTVILDAATFGDLSRSAVKETGWEISVP